MRPGVLSWVVFVAAFPSAAPVTILGADAQGTGRKGPERKQSLADRTRAAAPDRPRVAAGKVRLRIKLPRPHFAGTPKHLVRSPQLEPARKGPRHLPLVPKGTTNLARGKRVYSSDSEPIVGETELITDGDKETQEGCYVALGPGKQHVQIDLGKASRIYAIVLWHYHAEARVYRDVVVQASNDPDFITEARTLFNNDHDNSSGLGSGMDKEYIDKFEGKLVEGRGVKARYVRLHSNGNTSDNLNHYVEVEVYGKADGRD
jgi:hypothetical protein